MARKIFVMFAALAILAFASITTAYANGGGGTMVYRGNNPERGILVNNTDLGFNPERGILVNNTDLGIISK